VLVLLFDSVSRAWYSICAQRCQGQPFSLSHLATCLVVFVVVIVVITIVSLSPSRFSGLCSCFSLTILSALLFLCLGFDGFSVSSWWKQFVNNVLCFFLLWHAESSSL
jgi:hypothetical protein